MTGSGRTLTVEALTLRFGGITALDAITFTAEPGELLAVVGPNGAGKTALLNCINGIYRPTEGRIRLDGSDILAVPLHRRLSTGVARAFQHAELFPSLTVTENLLVGRHGQFRAGLLAGGLYWGRARREELAQRRAVEEIIDFFELYRHRDTRVGSLPYGVQKMVGLARALTTAPKLLLLDEPCTGLIHEEREDVARFLLRIKHELGPTTIWVEHDMQMVSDLADRVLVLNFGSMIAAGAPEAVRQDPQVLDAYLGRG
jgi:branched-chain amino acid transport system ATP-binding protein